MKKIIIVDDHVLVRAGMRTMLEETRKYKVIADYSDGNTFLADASGSDADLVLLDISMPGRNGLEIIHEIRKKNQKLPIIIVSMYSEKEFAVKSIKAGANGYISKRSSKDEILTAVDAVFKGGIYLTGDGLHMLQSHFSGSDPDYGADMIESLSPREQEVFRLLCEGKAIKEIAYDLTLSDRTVSTYKARIMEKTETENLVDLIKFGIEHGLV